MKSPKKKRKSPHSSNSAARPCLVHLPKFYPKHDGEQERSGLFPEHRLDAQEFLLIDCLLRKERERERAQTLICVEREKNIGSNKTSILGDCEIKGF
jgi:hypothetical protein